MGSPSEFDIFEERVDNFRQYEPTTPSPCPDGCEDAAAKNPPVVEFEETDENLILNHDQSGKEIL